VLTALLAALLVAAYLPAIRGGFIWDDDVYVTNNGLLEAPDGLQRIWFSKESPSQYFPLVYTVFRWERALWGLHPAGYHLVNVALHGANALLVGLLLARLAVPGAWLAAALFAFHPVQVESVAWVTELKNVLSTFWYLAALHAWLATLEARGRRFALLYAGALAAFLLGLFSKTTVVTLPAAMLVLLWYRGERIGRRRIAEILPFAACGLAMAGVTIWWERTVQGTQGDVFAFSLAERALIAGRALWFYLGTLAWPANLAFSYPRWQISPSDPVQYLWPAAAVAAGAALFALRRRLRAVAAAAAFFVVTLAPMLGFVPLYTFWYSFAADHYQYLAAAGPLALLAAALSLPAGGPRARRVLRAAPLLLVPLLAALTFRQARIYESRETLWRDTLAKNPASWLAAANLGAALFDAGKYEESRAAYRRTLELNPSFVNAVLALGRICVRTGDLSGAKAQLDALAGSCPGHYQLLKEEIKTAMRARGREGGRP
jgi:tetratricopeptide (TPR) repeat protein